jgi:AcrR family transcriptional regulator
VSNETVSHRPPGRPRSVRADEAIARATFEAIAEDGVEGMSIEGVAARAGVSKATIYRRYASKEALIVAIVGRLRPPPAAPADTGSFESDFKALVGGQERRARDVGTLIVPRLIAATLNNPGFRELLIERMIEPFRARIAEILRRGIERGELRADLDVDAAVDFLHGSLVYRLILAGGDPADLPGHAERLVPTLVAGLRA